ncbi:helix-turn-helix domain-containing protein [Fontivita pretiosa]|uniref:helix-turn-helix domain-containing protein n=1 Tax=Fontivita pretiosa TaxID=2989684 RepID=UPI003D17371D
MANSPLPVERLAAALADLLREAVAQVIREAPPRQALPPPQPEPLLVDRAGAAKLLGLSASTVDAMRRAGELPVIYVGAAPRFPVAGLREWAQARTKGGAK